MSLQVWRIEVWRIMQHEMPCRLRDSGVPSVMSCPYLVVGL